VTDNWIDSLKVGDEVAVRRGYGHASYELAVVQKVTATQIVLERHRFYKHNGRQVGGSNSYDQFQIMQPTPEIRESVRRAKLLRMLDGRNWSLFSTDQLERIAAIVAERKAVQAAEEGK
jgi:hypothetical protein